MREPRKYWDLLPISRELIAKQHVRGECGPDGNDTWWTWDAGQAIEVQDPDLAIADEQSWEDR
jgi:hypothetical protein